MLKLYECGSSSDCSTCPLNRNNFNEQKPIKQHESITEKISKAIRNIIKK